RIAADDRDLTLQRIHLVRLGVVQHRHGISPRREVRAGHELMKRILTRVRGIATKRLDKRAGRRQNSRRSAEIVGRLLLMDIFTIAELSAQRRQSGRLYLEFLRAPSCSAGVYELPAGGVDSQRPHTEDEIYYIVRGRGTIRVGEADQSVEPGTLVFVPANQP